VLAGLAGRGKKIVVLTEGLLIYLEASQVIALAKDLAGHPQFRRWILDMHSPALLRIMQRTTGKQLSQVGAPFKFGPLEGPQFLEPYGWRVVDVQGLLKNAARFKRPPFGLRLLSLLPEKKGAQGSRPWSGVCLFERVEQGQ